MVPKQRAMFIQLVVSTLILGSVVAVSPPRPEGDNETSAAAMTSFRCTLKDYEEHVRLFMDDLKVDGLPLQIATSRKLYEELKPYIALLPIPETRVVTKNKYREKCWCDGSIRSPCPEKCMNSCRWFTDNPTFPWKNENNCEGVKSRMTSCYCYEGSSTRCNYGNLSNCYGEDRTEVEQVPRSCSQHPVDERFIEQSLEAFFRITFLDPLRKQVQTLSDKVSTFTQTVMATDSLFNLTYASCCEKRNETPCYPEASSVLKEKLTEFVQLKKNITMDMNRLQENAASLTNNAKRTAISQIQEKVAMHECCLKGLEYSGINNECDAPASSHSSLPSPPSPTSS